MNKLTRIVAALLMVVGFTASADTIGRAPELGQPVTLDDRQPQCLQVNISYNIAVDRRTRQELNIYQALATAITQTAVLVETRDDRWIHAETPKKNITVRGNRLTMRYKQDVLEQECYLAVGPRQKWRTVNGNWVGRGVNASAIDRALTVLENNGLAVNKVTISVSSRTQVPVAQRLLRQLGLEHMAIVGHDPDKANHATVRFTKQTRKIQRR